jgi:superfamily II DNA or RNA helicase
VISTQSAHRPRLGDGPSRAQNSPGQLTSAPRQGEPPRLRPYQLAAVSATRAEFARGLRSTLLVLATGLGKTVCFSELARIEATHGIRTLVVAPREELVDQAKRKLEALGLWVGVEQGRRRSGNEPVVVATPQTLRGARLAKFARDAFGLVVIDEAQHAPAATNKAILDHFADARILGVTATPRRADGKALSEIFESVAFRMELREGIAGGWLAPIVARRVVVESVDLSRVATRGGDLAQDQLAAAMETERAVQGVVQPLLELARERKTLLFAVDVSHAYALAEAVNRIRPGAARAAHGELAPDDRRRLLAEFHDGGFQFLANVQLYTEGFDEPSVECVAIARPTKSLGLYQQIVGRGTRLSPETGKRDLLLLDFTGTAGRHRLVGPADCLAGSGELWPDDVAAEVNRLIGTAARDVQAVLDDAMAACSRRRGELEVDAIVKFHADELDVFLGAPADDGRRWSLTDRSSGDFARPTDKQLAALKKQGITLSRLPPSFSARDAAALFGRLAARRAEGLCSLKQAKVLRRAGLDARRISFARATELCTTLRLAGWHRPMVLWGEPEALEGESPTLIAAARRRTAETRAARAGSGTGATAAPTPASSPSRAVRPIAPQTSFADHEALP